MPEYQRAYIAGGTFFFTVATLQRQPLLTQELYRTALREVIAAVRKELPFQSLAWVLLPDHLHTIWTLPETDADFSLRWSLIKQHVTRQCQRPSSMVAPSRSRQKRGEGTIWQRRFWEHAIRNDEDLRRHVDYIHFNPVKHGYVGRPSNWPYSTLHKYIRDGIYPTDWAVTEDDQSQSYGE